MSQRKYSVSEVEELRQACRTRYVWGTYSTEGLRGASMPYCEKELVAAVEAHVRTCMAAGHTAADLIESERAKYAVPSSQTDETRTDG